MLTRSPCFAMLPFEGLKKAEAFYVKKLGFKRKSGSAKDGYLDFSAGKGTNFTVFESDSRKSEDTAITFAVKDLAKEMKALRKKGVKFVDYDLPEIKTVDGVFEAGEMRVAWFKDPGGNVLSLLQPG